MSNTAHINSIGIQSVDENGVAWYGTEEQTIPLGIEGGADGAVAFLAKLAEQFPFVNTIRVPFSSTDFDENGELHPVYTSFLEEVANQGLQLIVNYTDEYIQNFRQKATSDGTDKNTSKILVDLEAEYTNAEDILDVAGFEAAKLALIDGYLGTALDGWASMLSFMDDNPSIKNAVYGYELINEPASYSEIGDVDGDGSKDFDVRLDTYIGHIQELVDAHPDLSNAKILVGLTHYSGQMDLLRIVDDNGDSGFDRIREIVGDNLVWSAHLYPTGNSFATNGANATNPDEIAAYLQDFYGEILQDDVIITETNVPDGSANNYWNAYQLGANGEAINNAYGFARAAEWFADNGIGISWWPGIETGGSGFGAIQTFNLNNVFARTEHPNSIAHAANIMSYGENPDGDDGLGQIIYSSVLDNGNTRNTTYEDEFIGYAFGFGGDDIIYGGDNPSGLFVSADFLYGGYGKDIIYTGQGDDYAFGQQGNDILMSLGNFSTVDEYGEENYLNGGSGNDVLVAGAELNQLEGGAGNDVFYSNGIGHTVIVDFDAGAGGEQILFYSPNNQGYADLGAGNEILNTLSIFASFSELLNAATAVNANNTNDATTANDDDAIATNGSLDSTIITLPTGGAILIFGVLPSELVAENFGFTEPNGIVDGTSADDVISLNYVDADGEGVTDDGTIDEIIYGYDGNDRIILYRGSDIAYGGNGDDLIIASNSYSQMYGEAGDDTLLSGGRSSSLFGGDGDDHLIANLSKGGDHTLNGGAGADHFELLYASSTRQSTTVVEYFELGIDSLTVLDTEIDLTSSNSLPSDMSWTEIDGTLNLNFSDDETIVFTGLNIMDIGPQPNGIVDGTSADDVISLNYVDADGEGVTDDGTIDEIIYGYDGNDRIILYRGSDIAYGGNGDDLIIASNSYSQMYGEAGDDTLLSGGRSSSLFGGDGDDHLIANLSKGGDHTLNGGAGADHFELLYASSTRQSTTVVEYFELGIDSLTVLDTEIDLTSSNSLPSDMSWTEIDGTLNLNFSDDETIVFTGLNIMDIA